MDCTYYKCKTCGFVHQVPAYWSGFAPEEEIEMLHVNLETKDACEDTVLHIIKE
ncbi:hypothetical protein [Acidaminobacter sp. JC074]|uniref:hypothetical protein n=1 Tax=Acidaminobacter sp. JC074 TaxID=2530199 RepID=UPI001F0E974B|nr:hypothetical protein [Acidaminobacter sp. JC074]